MKELLLQYKNTVIGFLIGLALVILIFTIGFWKSLFALIIIGTCVFIGFSIDQKINVKGYIDEIWNKKDWK